MFEHDLLATRAEPAPVWRMALGGVPDFITVAVFWLCWQRSSLVAPDLIASSVMSLLLEFIVIQFSGFGLFIGKEPSTRRAQISLRFAIFLFYLLLIAAAAYAVGATWMHLLLGWLFFSKTLVVWTASTSGGSARMEQFIDWPFSVAAYLAALLVGLSVFRDVPGSITPEIFTASGLDGAGMFEDRPWAALGAGMLYFGAMGLWRLRLWRWFGGKAAQAL